MEMMKICQIMLILFAQYKSGAVIWGNNFEIKQPTTDESVILGEIITQFLIKYFSEGTTFVSIVLGPSKKCRCQCYFQEDFFNELFDHPLLTEFSHNVLDKIDKSALDKRNAFNLVLVEDCESLA